MQSQRQALQRIKRVSSGSEHKFSKHYTLLNLDQQHGKDR
jgi:hypothetical protein